MTEEWYRRTTWSPADREAFFARLARSRTAFNKAQYLRIQAAYLAEQGTDQLIHAALELLDLMLRDYPERSEVACAHEQRARCFSDLGKHEQALEAYRQALAAQRAYPQAQTMAHTGYAELVVSLNRRELFAEVLGVLDEFGRHDLFPIDAFKQHAARALIAADAGNLDEAREHASRALAAASATESGFARHKKLGLVAVVIPDLEERLRRLSAA